MNRSIDSERDSVCVCVCERERQCVRERKRERERERISEGTAILSLATNESSLIQFISL